MAQTTSQIAWIEGLSPADPPRRGLEFLPLVGRKSSANGFFERAIAHYMNDFEVRKRPDWPAGLSMVMEIIAERIADSGDAIVPGGIASMD